MLDLAFDLLGTRPEFLFLQAGDADLERLDERIISPFRRRQPGDLDLLGHDDGLERGKIVGQGAGAGRHVRRIAENH